MKRIKKQWGVFVSTILLILSGVLLSISPAMGYVYDWTFTLTPSGDLSGAPGETLTWGYTIENKELEESGNWLILWSLGSDAWAYGNAEALLIDLPTIGPGTSATGSLYSFTWDNDAPMGFVNSGVFTVTGDWYDSNNDVWLYDDTKTAAYSAQVVPEPSTLLLLCTGLLGLVGAGRKSVQFLR